MVVCDITGAGILGIDIYIYIYTYTSVLPSISIDDDRFEEYGVLMALQEGWLVLMLWTGLEDLGVLGLPKALRHPSGQGSPSRRFFERLWRHSGEVSWTVFGHLAVQKHPEV